MWFAAPILVGLALGLKLTTAFAADQPILGRQLLVLAPGTPDKRRVAVDAREWGTPNSVVGDPTVAGATLTIRVDGDFPTEETFPLPQGTNRNGRPFWTGTSTAGFKYKDANGEQGPVSAVQIRKTVKGDFPLFLIKVKASARHAPLSIVPPNAGTGGCVLLELGDGDSYSVAFATGTITNKGSLLFKVSRPPSEGTCAPPPTTTSTTTTTTTTTASTTSTTASTTTTTTSPSSTTTTSTTTTTTSTTSTTTSTTSTTTSTSSTTTSTISTTTSTTSTIVPTTSTTIVATTTTTASTTSTTTSTTTTTTSTTIAQPCNPDSESYNQPAFYRTLAYRWAPLIMHDTASKWYADLIGRMDYDGDWIGNDNWQNLPSSGIAPYIYYAVLETSTHWFIYYNTFHPRDWDDVFFGTCAPLTSDCHENDTENIFMMIQKDGTTYGRFRLMETEAHTSFYQYALANDGVSNGTGPDADDIDDDAERGFSLFVDSSVGVNDPRPAIYIESKGHGICDWWDNNGPYCTHPDDKVGSSGNDGVMYYPSATAVPTVPANPTGGQWFNFKYPYQLISVWDDVWVLRSCLGNGKTFDQAFTYPGVSGNGTQLIGGAMDGDDYSADAGTAWWAQNHGNLAEGDWGMDPARTVVRQLTFAETVDTHYVYNPFFGIQ